MRMLTAAVMAAVISASVSSAPALASDGVTTMCVTGVAPSDVLNIRAGPSAQSAKIGAVPPDACITVVGICDGWCAVQVGAIDGFASAHFLRPADGYGQGPNDGHGPDAYCVRDVASDDVLNVRSGPNASRSKVGALPYDACGVRITGQCVGRWCPIEWRGIYGFVNTRFLGE